MVWVSSEFHYLLYDAQVKILKSFSLKITGRRHTVVVHVHRSSHWHALSSIAYVSSQVIPPCSIVFLEMVRYIVAPHFHVKV